MNGKLDRNGYAPSVISNHSPTQCWLCGRNGCGKMDRHEVYHGAYRNKSKRFGLWVHLCHVDCHLNGVHARKNIDMMLKREAQREAMEFYDWDTSEFIWEFGKNYFEEDR